MDAIIRMEHQGLTQNTYRIISNPGNLTDRQLADRAEGQGMYYGYHRAGDRLTVYTD